MTDRQVLAPRAPVRMGTMSSLPTIDHWSGGATYAGTSGRYADVTNPASGQVSGQVALA